MHFAAPAAKREGMDLVPSILGRTCLALQPSVTSALSARPARRLVSASAKIGTHRDGGLDAQHGNCTWIY